MIVSFPFTFSFNVPGLPNPFSPNYSQSPPYQTTSGPTPPTGNHTDPGSRSVIQSKESTCSSMAIPQNRIPNSPSPSFTTISKSKNLKRGWEPAFAEPSQSTPTLASTSGYLDSPAKYREMLSAESVCDLSEGKPSSRMSFALE